MPSAKTLFPAAQRYGTNDCRGLSTSQLMTVSRTHSTVVDLKKGYFEQGLAHLGSRRQIEPGRSFRTNLFGDDDLGKREVRSNRPARFFAFVLESGYGYGYGYGSGSGSDLVYVRVRRLLWHLA